MVSQRSACHALDLSLGPPFCRLATLCCLPPQSRCSPTARPSSRTSAGGTLATKGACGIYPVALMQDEMRSHPPLSLTQPSPTRLLHDCIQRHGFGSGGSEPLWRRAASAPKGCRLGPRPPCVWSGSHARRSVGTQDVLLKRALSSHARFAAHAVCLWLGMPPSSLPSGCCWRPQGLGICGSPFTLPSPSRRSALATWQAH